MSDQYIDYRKAKNIRPISLPDKERYLLLSPFELYRSKINY